MVWEVTGAQDKNNTSVKGIASTRRSPGPFDSEWPPEGENLAQMQMARACFYLANDRKFDKRLEVGNEAYIEPKLWLYLRCQWS